MNEPKRPNIVWVFSDQHRAHATSWEGDANVHTPCIDALAAQGTWFSNAVSGYPLCMPFRRSLLSSVYPHEGRGGKPMCLDPEALAQRRMVAEVFRDHGYQTAYFGKWHLSEEPRGHDRRTYEIPESKRAGFEHWCAFELSNRPFETWTHGTDGAHRLTGHQTSALTEKFTDYLKAQAGDSSAPFFAVCSFEAPHDPYVAPPEYMQRFHPEQLNLRGNVPSVPRVERQACRELAGYYAAVEHLDHCLSAIVDTLRQTRLDETTIVVFFSDHGDMLGSHGYFRKTSPWEESIRIPFIISTPQHTGPRATDAPMNHVDIAPTSLGLCGIAVPSWMRGRDFSKAVLKPAQWEGPASSYLQKTLAQSHQSGIVESWRCLRRNDGWKLTCCEGTPLMLFNLCEDPLEQVNLAFQAEGRAKVRELLGEMRAWANELGDPFRFPDV
jgi:arylsulfatase A-like enzyme